MIIVIDVVLAVLWFGLAHDWVGYGFAVTFAGLAVYRCMQLAQRRERDARAREAARRWFCG